MGKLAIGVLIMAVSGCNNKEIWEHLNKCAELYKESCVVVMVPDSKGDDMRALYAKWLEEMESK